VTARAALLHPIALAAIALLVINDHVLKGTAPGVLTGKLSDVAGMIFFPLFLAAVLELFGARHRRLVLGCAIATGIVFAATKTIPIAADAYRYGLGAIQWPFHALFAIVRGHASPSFAPVAMVMDPTDVIALPALIVPVWLTSRSSRRA
jgi:hypothetical protein